MSAIFISYRKDDTPGAAAHLFKNLAETFGPGSVVMDVARGQPERDVRQVIGEQLATSAVMLVVIGKTWVDARDEDGQRCLDNPLDLVRLETAAALEQKLPVIPVLVHGAAMVQPGQLPPDLADLEFCNPVSLTQSHWGSDVEALVKLLQGLVRHQAPSAAATAAAGRPREADVPAAAPQARIVRPKPVGKAPWRTVLAAMGVVGVLALGVYGFMVSRPAPAPDLAVAKAPAVVAAASRQAVVAPVEMPPVAQPAVPPALAPAQQVAVRAELEAAAPQQSAASAGRAERQVMAAAPAPPEPLPTAPTGAAKALSFQKWTLNSGGCGAGPVTVTGTARFSIEKTSDAIVVTEEFRGSGSGFDVVVTGQVEFSREQPSYDIPTSGQWTGSTRTFKTAGTDRVSTSDGITPKGANVVMFKSLCG
jgi:TIR domain